MTDEVARGLTPGRKIKAAMLMSFWLSLSAGVLHKVGVPIEVIQWVLGITGLGWLTAIGGQALVDTFAKWAEARKPPTP